MRSRCGRARGVTMVEMLVAIFMLATCLAIVASQYADASRALSREEASDTVVRTLRVCFDTLTADIEQSRFSSLTPRGQSGHALTLQRIDPACALRGLSLPLPLDTDPPAPAWVTVRWTFDAGAGRLLREVAQATTPVGQKVLDFTVRVRDADLADSSDPVGVVECAITVQAEGGRTTTASTLLRPRVCEASPVPEP